MEQMCTAVFAFLESAKPFFQYGKLLQELLPFFVRALGGILPLDALAIVRMEGKKGVCETACWSGTPHLPEALMLRAFNGKEFPNPRRLIPRFRRRRSPRCSRRKWLESSTGWRCPLLATPMRSACCLSAGSPEKRSGRIGSGIFYGLCAPCSGFSSREKHIANSNVSYRRA